MIALEHEHMGGAVARVAETGTVFQHRRERKATRGFVTRIGETRSAFRGQAEIRPGNYFRLNQNNGARSDRIVDLPQEWCVAVWKIGQPTSIRWPDSSPLVTR